MSPARVLGPAIVFNCHWDTAWVYILGGECFVPVADHQSYSPVLFLTIHFAAHEGNMQRRKGCRLFEWGTHCPRRHRRLSSRLPGLVLFCMLTIQSSRKRCWSYACSLHFGEWAIADKCCRQDMYIFRNRSNIAAELAKFQQQSCSALITSCFADILTLNKCCKVACLQKHPYIHICELVQACRKELCLCSQPMNLKATCECLQTWLGAL